MASADQTTPAHSRHESLTRNSSAGSAGHAVETTPSSAPNSFPATQARLNTGTPHAPQPVAKATNSEPSPTALNLTPPSGDLPNGEIASEILKLAADAFAKTGSWVVFYRELLGRNGVAYKSFKTDESMAWFQTTPQHAEIQEMVAALRSQDSAKGDAVEPERMITIRLPKSLHDVLTAESEQMNLSINKLCISKLLQPPESRYIPVQQGRRRGRRPGPQGSRKKSQAAE